jgi:hypothetical protein
MDLPLATPAMDRTMKTTITLLATGLIACGASAMNLTGITTYGLTNSDESNNAEEWTTESVTAEWKMFAKFNGQWMNKGGNARIDIPLQLGTNVVQVYGDGAGAPRYGMTFLFDGMDLSPRIAAGSDQGTGVFNMIAAGKLVPDLYGSARLSPASLSWSDGSVVATLTGMQFANGHPGGLDIVSPNDLGPNGRPDNVGTLTFEVSTVPEPTSLVCLGLGITAFVKRRRK